MFKNYFKGLQAYGDSFSLISKLNLWKYFLIPMGISLLVAFIIGFSSWGWSDDLGVFISKIWVWEWGSETFRAISNFIGGLTIAILGLIIYRHLVMALCAPFMGPVSEKIEAHLTNTEVTVGMNRFIPLLIRGIKVNGRNLFFELFFTIPALLLSFIPVIGFLSAPILFLLQAYYAGFGNMDYTLERHLSFKESIRFVRSRSGLAMGNGTVFLLLLLIPVLGILLVLPLSVTAATKVTINTLHPEKS